MVATWADALKTSIELGTETIQTLVVAFWAVNTKSSRRVKLITFVALTFITAINVVTLTVISARVELEVAVAIGFFRSLAELVEVRGSDSRANVAFVVESE